MGNIYVKQKNYPKAIKMYRMALDQVSSNKEMRTKIMQNIGLVFVRMSQYKDAITSFEHIMSEIPNIKTGFNLILCYKAIGDRESMKTAFQKLISIPLGIDDEDKYIPSNVGPGGPGSPSLWFSSRCFEWRLCVILSGRYQVGFGHRGHKE